MTKECSFGTFGNLPPPSFWQWVKNLDIQGDSKHSPAFGGVIITRRGPFLSLPQFLSGGCQGPGPDNSAGEELSWEGLHDILAGTFLVLDARQRLTRYLADYDRQIKFESKKRIAPN